MRVLTTYKNVKVVERPAGTVNILNLKKKKKKKRYSRGMGDIDALHTAIGKHTRRVTKGQLEGISTWLDLSQKSAQNKKDGAFKDSLKNSSKSLRKMNRQLAKAQPDFMDEIVNMRSTKRAMRKRLRRMF